MQDVFEWFNFDGDKVKSLYVNGPIGNKRIGKTRFIDGPPQPAGKICCHYKV
jgi:hypothetical protein